MNFKGRFLLMFITCLCCLLGSGDLFGQDIITRKDGKKMKVVIKEVSDTEIKYVDYRDVEGVVLVIDRSLIREIKFSHGEKIKEDGPNQDRAYYVDDRNQIIKFNFSAIGDNFTILTYERAINNASSMEYSLKFPGLGINRNNTDFSGIGLTVGYKLKIGSIFKNDGYRPGHLLEGGYVRMSAGYLYSVEKGRGFQNGTELTRSLAHIGVELGKQWIISNRAAFDIYIGYNYFGGSEKFEMNDARFGNFQNDRIRGGDIFGFNNSALSIGIRVGGLFGNYGKATGKKKKL